MSVYLDNLRNINNMPSANTVMPILRPGEYVGDDRDPRIASLRLQQMRDLARAFNIEHSPNANRIGMERVLQNALAMGVFSKPPVNAYYYERAKYTADEMKEAKTRGGYFVRKKTGHVEEMIPCTVLLPWIGPDPEGDKKPKNDEQYTYEGHQKKASAAGVKARVMDGLRREAKALGINSWGMKREALARAIAEKKGQIAPQENAA